MPGMRNAHPAPGPELIITTLHPDHPTRMQLHVRLKRRTSAPTLSPRCVRAHARTQVRDQSGADLCQGEGVGQLIRSLGHLRMKWRGKILKILIHLF